MGLVKTNRELTTQEKVAARASLVIRGLRVAQGDLSNTQSGFANASRAVFGRMQNAMDDLGQSLMPIAERFLSVVNRMLSGVSGFVDRSKPRIESFVQSFLGIAEYAQWMAEQFGEAVAGLGSKLIEEVQSWTAYKVAVDALGKAWEWLKTQAAEIFEGLGFIWRNWSDLVAIGTIRVRAYLQSLGKLWNWLMGEASKYLEWFKRSWKALFIDQITMSLKIVENLGKNLGNLFQALVDWANGRGFHFNFTPLLEGFQATAEKLPPIAMDALHKINEEIEKQIKEDSQGYVASVAENERKQQETLNKPKPNEQKKPEAARGQRARPGEAQDPKAAKNAREAEEAIRDKTVAARRAIEDLHTHLRGGDQAGRFVGLTDFAKQVQSGALNTAEYQRKTLRLMEDEVKAIRELSDAIEDQQPVVPQAQPG